MKYIKLFKSQVLQESFLANDNGQVDRPHFSYCDATDNFGLDSDVEDYEPAVDPVDPSSGGGDEPGGGDTPAPVDTSTGGDTPVDTSTGDDTGGNDNTGGDDTGGDTHTDEPGD